MHAPGLLLLHQLAFELGEWDVRKLEEMSEARLLEWVCFLEWREKQLERKK